MCVFVVELSYTIWGSLSIVRKILYVIDSKPDCAASAGEKTPVAVDCTAEDSESGEMFGVSGMPLCVGAAQHGGRCPLGRPGQLRGNGRHSLFSRVIRHGIFAGRGMRYQCRFELRIYDSARCNCQKSGDAWFRAVSGNLSPQRTQFHENRLRAEIPPHGSIRMLVITEKQYHSIRILLGRPTVYDEPQSSDSLMIF